MAKRGTLDHPKTLHLASILKVEPWAALGILEAFWHWVAKYAPTGDLTRHSFTFIAEGMRYSQDAEGLKSALLTARWVVAERGWVVVHDWHEHADQSVKKALAYHKKVFVELSPEFRGEYPTICGESPLHKDILPEACSQKPVASSQMPVPVPFVNGASAEIPRDELARHLAGDLLDDHPKPGNVAYAEAAIGKILSDSVDPDRECRAIRESHKAYCEYWAAESARNHKLFIPQLHRWFADGDYKHPPSRGQPKPSNSAAVVLAKKRLNDS